MASAGFSFSGAPHGEGRRAPGAAGPKKPALKQLAAVWPDLWALIQPRRGLLALGLLLMVINRVSGLVLPASTKFLVDNVIVRRQLSLLTPLLAVVIAATLIQGASSYALTQALSTEAQRLIAQLRRQVQAHVGRLHVAYYDANKTGTLVARIMSDVEGIRNLLGTGLVQFAGGLLTALIALVVMARISPTMTVVAFSCLLGFSLALRRGFGVLRPIFRERSRINAEVTGRLTESLAGVRVVKGYHAEGREAAVFSGGVERLLANVLRAVNGTSFMGLSAALLMGLLGTAIMYMGVREIMAGHLTLGGFFTYTLFLGYLVAPLGQVVNIGTQITEALAGLERTHEVLAEAPEHLDPERKAAPAAIQGVVRFEHVDFAYTPDKPVLHDVSFTAEPGTATALVGSSGSGKSTIIGLIAAFHKPTAGRITLDGTDLSHIRLSWYRPQLGVVLQESFLFDGTIAENVAFSRPDAGREEILSACRLARVDEFAERFEEGYETVVGERGVKLSGGQRQRISIARAILAEPRILILDEATSSLDSESEAMIQQGLSHLMAGRTTFVIAHRLSTIRRADQILVVEGGAIVEQGRHADLLAAHGRYYDLYTRQHGLERDLFLAPGEGDTFEAAGAAAGEVSPPAATSLLRGEI